MEDLNAKMGWGNRGHEQVMDRQRTGTLNENGTLFEPFSFYSNSRERAQLSSGRGALFYSRMCSLNFT